MGGTELIGSGTLKKGLRGGSGPSAGVGTDGSGRSGKGAVPAASLPTMGARIMGAVGLFTLITLSIFGATIVGVYRAHARARLDELISDSTEVLRRSADDLFAEAERCTRLVLGASSVQELLVLRRGYGDPARYRPARATLEGALITFPWVGALYLWDLEGNRFSVSPRQGFSLSEDWNLPADAFRQADQAEGRPVWLIDWTSPDASGRRRAIPVAVRLVSDLDTFIPIGYVAAAVFPERIEALLTPDVNRLFSWGLYDASGRLLWHGGRGDSAQPSAGAAGKTSLPRLSPDFGSGRVFGAEGRRVRAIPLDGGRPWIIAGSAEDGIAPEESNLLPALAVGMALCAGIFMISGASAITRMVSRPVNALAASMGEAGDGRFTAADFDPPFREFAELRDGHNRMLERLGELIAGQAAAERAKREYQLRLLQAQMNPHFLYNTLDSIASLVLVREHEQAADLIVLLGRYYRRALSHGDDVVTLETELAIVTTYVNIQRVRHPDLLTLVCDVQDEALTAQLPKLTLQPLVENAIHHGIEPSGRPGRILLWGRVAGGRCSFRVEDDGVGATVPSTSSGSPGGQAEKGRAESGGFGLAAAEARLRLLYPEEVDWRVDTGPGSGFAVEFAFPAPGWPGDEEPRDAL